MKRTEPQSVGRIIEMALNSGAGRDTVLEQRACYLWTEVVGPGINGYTYRRYVDHGVMHVYISSASLKNELSFHRTRIIEMINRLVGEDVIKQLEFH